MTNVMLIGHGAREHAIAEAFARNKTVNLYSYMKSKNPGVLSFSKKAEIGPYSDLENIKKFALSNNIDFAFIGPEDPLSFGVVDALEEEGINFNVLEGSWPCKRGFQDKQPAKKLRDF